MSSRPSIMRPTVSSKAYESSELSNNTPQSYETPPISTSSHSTSSSPPTRSSSHATPAKNSSMSTSTTSKPTTTTTTTHSTSTTNHDSQYYSPIDPSTESAKEFKYSEHPPSIRNQYKVSLPQKVPSHSYPSESDQPPKSSGKHANSPKPTQIDIPGDPGYTSHSLQHKPKPGHLVQQIKID